MLRISSLKGATAKWLSLGKTMAGINKWGYVSIVLVWLITQGFILSYFGIYTQEEARVYINIADAIVQGNWNHSIHYWLYSGYIGVLVILRYFGMPYEAMYVLQLLLSFLAVHCFIKLLSGLQISKFAVFAGGLLFASSPLFHAWNSHLYTDGYFGSLVVISLYLINKNAKGTLISFFFLFLLLVYASFVRPVGFLLPFMALLYLFFHKGVFTRILLLSIWVLLIVMITKLSLTRGSNFFYPNHNLELNIICGYPSALNQHEVKPYNMGMSIASYFLQNPKMTFMLGFNRAFKSLWMTRPYFSPAHNFVLGSLCSLYYLLAITGIISVFRKKNLKNFYFLIFALIWLVPNILFCADWHNRFMIPFIPALLVLAAFGIDYINHCKNSLQYFKKTSWEK
jgi:hypothetical protein